MELASHQLALGPGRAWRPRLGRAGSEGARPPGRISGMGGWGLTLSGGRKPGRVCEMWSEATSPSPSAPATRDSASARSAEIQPQEDSPGTGAGRKPSPLEEVSRGAVSAALQGRAAALGRVRGKDFGSIELHRLHAAQFLPPALKRARLLSFWRCVSARERTPTRPLSPPTGPGLLGLRCCDVGKDAVDVRVRPLNSAVRRSNPGLPSAGGQVEEGPLGPRAPS